MRSAVSTPGSNFDDSMNPWTSAICCEMSRREASTLSAPAPSLRARSLNERRTSEALPHAVRRADGPQHVLHDPEHDQAEEHADQAISDDGRTEGRPEVL